MPGGHTTPPRGGEAARRCTRRNGGDDVVARLHAITTLDEGFIRRTNLRWAYHEFAAELLRGQGLAVGRIDGRFAARDMIDESTGRIFIEDEAGTGEVDLRDEIEAVDEGLGRVVAERHVVELDACDLVAIDVAVPVHDARHEQLGVPPEGRRDEAERGDPDQSK